MLAFSCSTAPPVVIEPDLSITGAEIQGDAEAIQVLSGDLVKEIPDNEKAVELAQRASSLVDKSKELNAKIKEYNDKVIEITKEFNTIWQKAEQLKTEIEKLKGQRNILFLVSVFLVLAIVVFVYLKRLLGVFG